MKKILLLLMMSLSFFSVKAQKTVQGSGFLDDWSVGALAGVATPSTHSAFWGGMRPVYGIEMTKYIVPEFGLGTQFLMSHNTTPSSTIFDVTNVLLLGHLNLSNWFASYLGRPRSFELVAVFGAGWGHEFNNASQGADYNYMTSKVGLDLQFFLGAPYAWSIGVKPALIYNLDGGKSQPVYNVNRSAMELLVGVTYHFKNANNGKHHFTLQRVYDPTEIDALNAKVNGLHQKVQEKEAALEKVREEISSLKEQLKEVQK